MAAKKRRPVLKVRKPLGLTPIPETDTQKARAGVQSLATLPAVAAALDQIETAMGGRQALVTALVGAPLDDDLTYVLRCLADPRQDARKLSTVCAQMGITMTQVFEALKRGIYAHATIEAMRLTAQATPGIVQDVLARAVPHDEPCADCRGFGTVTSVAKPDAPPTLCAACHGTGTIRVLPDLDRQQYALSLGPLSPKDSPLVNVDNRSVTIAHHSPQGFAKLLAATDRILHRRAPTEATVVDLTPENDE